MTAPTSDTPITDALVKKLIDEGCDFTRPANQLALHADRLERTANLLREALEYYFAVNPPPKAKAALAAYEALKP